MRITRGDCISSQRVTKLSFKISKRLSSTRSQTLNGPSHLPVLRASSKISKTLPQVNQMTKSWLTLFCIGNSREISQSEKKEPQVLTRYLLQNKILCQLKLSSRRMARSTRRQPLETELTKAKQAWPRSCATMATVTVLFFKQDQTCTSLSRMSLAIHCSYRSMAHSSQLCSHNRVP